MKYYFYIFPLNFPQTNLNNQPQSMPQLATLCYGVEMILGRRKCGATEEI